MYPKLILPVPALAGIALLLLSCAFDGDEGIPGFKPHEILVVSLDPRENQDIEKVVLVAGRHKDSL